MPSTSEAGRRILTNTAHQPRLTLYRACGYLLFFLMLFVPTTYQPVKLALLLICLVAITTAKPSIRIQISFARTTLLLSGIGALEILYGTMRGNEGAYQQITVWILWPLVFLILSSAIYTEQHLLSIFRVMVVASIAIGIYGCLYVLTLTGRIPSGLYFDGINQGQSLFFQGGIISVSLYSFSSLLFLLPFLIALAMTWPKERKPVVRSYWIYLGIVLNVTLVVLSGRRALMLGVALTPIILIVASRLSRARLVRFVFPSIALCVAAVVAVRALHIDVEATLTYLTSGYKSVGDEARRLEFQSLMDGWREHPIFGAGLGAVASGPLRSLETPWAYELSYVALLFDIGVVGVLFYGTVIGNVIRRTVSVARTKVELRPWAIPVLVGMAGSLIGNATNPYLLKFDSMWVWFIPVALLNVNAVLKTTEPQSTDASMTEAPLGPAPKSLRRRGGDHG